MFWPNFFVCFLSFFGLVNFNKHCAARVCGVLGCVALASRDAYVTASGDARKNDVYRIDYN